jgi:hypothetical protein
VQPSADQLTTVVSLTAAVYAGLAFDRLPILADALKDAGCDHPDHARGCWVVDLVLRKS